MSIRSVLARISLTSREFGRSGGRAPRYFSDSTGRVLSEEERAKEAVYIQKMERERLEKLKKMEKETAEAERNKKPEDPQKG